jgi:hypothetical protein
MLVAKPLGFKEADFFALDDPAAVAVPRVALARTES